MISDDWFHRGARRPNARIRLFCFPHAGGGAASYRSWSDHLSSDVEVCACRLPGRESRLNEPPISQMSLLVPVLARALTTWLDRPFAFFGHSMGALLAYELVRHLRCQSRQLPFHLFVAARGGPQVVARLPPCHELPDPEFIHCLVERYGGIPGAVLESSELMELLLPTLRADLELAETYRCLPGEPLDQPVTAVGGAQDQSTTAEELRAWKQVTRGPFRLHVLAGGHFFVQDSEVELLRIIGGALEGV